MLDYKNLYIYSLGIFIVIMMTTIPGSYGLTYPLALLSLALHYKDIKFVRNNKTFIWMFVFIIITFCYVFCGYGYFEEFRNVAWLYYILLLSCLLTPFIFSLEYEYLGLLKNIIVGCIIITLIGSLYVSFIDPLAVRNLGFGESEYSDENQLATLYFHLGMMSYHIAHGMAVIPPILMILFIERKKFYERIVYMVLFILLQYVFFECVVTTAMLSSFTTSLIVLIYYCVVKYKFSRFISILILPLLLISVDTSILKSIFQYLSLYANSSLEAKFQDIIISLEGGPTSQIDYRGQLHEISLNAFYNNPFLGLADKDLLGKHSLIFDYLAIYGIFGCFPLFLSVYYNITSQIILMPTFYKRLYFICLIPYVILCYSKGTSFLGIYIFFLSIVLPIVFHWLIKVRFGNNIYYLIYEDYNFD